MTGGILPKDKIGLRPGEVAFKVNIDPHRVKCVVPFCNRSRLDTETIEILHEGHYHQLPADLWICGRHWQPVPRVIKGLVRAARRKLKAEKSLRALKLYNRVWDRAAKAAKMREFP